MSFFTDYESRKFMHKGCIIDHLLIISSVPRCLVQGVTAASVCNVSLLYPTTHFDPAGHHQVHNMLRWRGLPHCRYGVLLFVFANALEYSRSREVITLPS